MVDPVTAYNHIAPAFYQIANVRRAYLAQVEQSITREFPKSARSMLDVGAGDGSRARRISKSCGIQRLVLLEPSAPMQGTVKEGAETLDIRAEELENVQDEFDVITCLWNVLGHVNSSERRAEVIRQCFRLLRNGGTLFMDVNHRYNASQYGTLPTLLRLLWDKLRPDERNGDVIMRWHIDGKIWATTGHVFTDSEMQILFKNAGFHVQKRIVVHYSTGQIRQRVFEGNLLYVMVKEAIV